MKDSKQNTKTDPMRGFKFIKFDWGTNHYSCKKCGRRIMASTPRDFVEQADPHRKECKK